MFFASSRGTSMEQFDVDVNHPGNEADIPIILCIEPHRMLNKVITGPSLLKTSWHSAIRRSHAGNRCLVFLCLCQNGSFLTFHHAYLSGLRRSTLACGAAVAASMLLPQNRFGSGSGCPNFPSQFRSAGDMATLRQEFVLPSSEISSVWSSRFK